MSRFTISSVGAWLLLSGVAGTHAMAQDEETPAEESPAPEPTFEPSPDQGFEPWPQTPPAQLPGSLPDQTFDQAPTPTPDAEIGKEGDVRPAMPGSFFGSGSNPEEPKPTEDLDALIKSTSASVSVPKVNVVDNGAISGVSDDIGKRGMESFEQGLEAQAAAAAERRRDASEAAAAAVNKRQAEEADLMRRAEASRKQREYDPERAKQLEQCIAGFDNGTCVASPKATAQTRSLVGEDLTELLDYQNNRSWSKTSLVQIGERMEQLGEGADKLGAVVDFVGDAKGEGGQKAMESYVKGESRAKVTNMVIDAQADGRATTITPRAVTTTEIGADGVPVIKATVEKTDYGAGVTKLATEALEDAKTIKDATGKNPLIAVPVIGGKYVKWVTKREGGPGGANAIMETQNREDVRRADALSGALKQVAQRDPNWMDRTVLPTEVSRTASKFYTYETRQSGAVVEKLYWQAWAKARQHRGQ